MSITDYRSFPPHNVVNISMGEVLVANKLRDFLPDFNVLP